MRHLFPLLVSIIVSVVTACGGTSNGPDGGGSGGDAGGGGGGQESLLPCTPDGFTTAPAKTNTLAPTFGTNAADEQQAYAEWESDGGSLLRAAVDITLATVEADGGAQAPVGITARFNGCALGAPTIVPGVGPKFGGSGSTIWVPTASRFLAFELVESDTKLLYREVHETPATLPRISEVTLLSSTQARARWAPIAPPVAATTTAYLSAWKRIGTSGAQSLGVSTVSPATGEATMTVSGVPTYYTLELQMKSGLRNLRLVSRFTVIP